MPDRPVLLDQTEEEFVVLGSIVLRIMPPHFTEHADPYGPAMCKIIAGHDVMNAWPGFDKRVQPKRPDCLVFVVGGLPPGSKNLPDARSIVADSLAKILPPARASGVKLALEPLHPMTCADRSVLSTTAQALDLADALGDGVGVALDVYHIWWDPALAASIGAAHLMYEFIEVPSVRLARRLKTDDAMLPVRRPEPTG